MRKPEDDVTFDQLAALEEELHLLKTEKGIPSKEGFLSRNISNYFERKEQRQPIVIPRKKYLLLLLLTGWMGGHLFYTKHYIKGVLCLLFSWTGMPLAMAIIDLMATLPKPVDEAGNISI